VAVVLGIRMRTVATFRRRHDCALGPWLQEHHRGLRGPSTRSIGKLRRALSPHREVVVALSHPERTWSEWMIAPPGGVRVSMAMPRALVPAPRWVRRRWTSRPLGGSRRPARPRSRPCPRGWGAR
jgi:hypothetical protein